MLSESPALSPICPEVTNDPNTAHFFPSQSLQNLIDQIVKKPETKEKEQPKIIVIQEQESLIDVSLNLKQQSNPVDLNKKNLTEPRSSLGPISRPSIEALHKIDRLNVDSTRSSTLISARSLPTEASSGLVERRKLRLYIPKQDSNTLSSSYNADSSSSGVIQSHVIPHSNTHRDIENDLIPNRKMSSQPHFNVSTSENPKEIQKRQISFMPNRLAPLNPYQKSSASGSEPITNDYLYNVFSSKNGAGSLANTSKNCELGSVNEDQFIKRGSFSVFRKVVEAELGKRF